MTEIKLSAYFEIDWKNLPKELKKAFVEIIEQYKAKKTKHSEKFDTSRIDVEIKKD